MNDLDITLPEHEQHSEQRAERVIEAIHQQCNPNYQEGNKMSDHEKMEVKNIFEGGRDGGGSLSTMAAIAALGNRNESGNNSMWPMMMANSGGFGGGGFGSGLVGGIIGGALFGGRRGGGGLFGGGEDCCDNGVETRIEDTVFNTAVLSKLGNIEASIPLASAQTANVILQQTNALTNLSTQAQLASAAGFALTKDAVQGAAVLNLQATGNAADRVISAISALSSKIDANRILQLEADLVSARLSDSEGRHARDVQALRTTVEVNNTANATQVQAQAQQQAQFQFQDLNNKFARLCDMVSLVHQEARATNANIIAGNTGAVTTGAQTSTPTNVNAR
jgi:hypothetical protein